MPPRDDNSPGVRGAPIRTNTLDFPYFFSIINLNIYNILTVQRTICEANAAREKSCLKCIVRGGSPHGSPKAQIC